MLKRIVTVLVGVAALAACGPEPVAQLSGQGPATHVVTITEAQRYAIDYSVSAVEGRVCDYTPSLSLHSSDGRSAGRSIPEHRAVQPGEAVSDRYVTFLGATSWNVSLGVDRNCTWSLSITPS